VSVEILSIEAVLVETLIICLGESVEILSTEVVSVDAQCRGGVGRDTDNLNTAQNKGWVGSGNDRRERATRKPPVGTSKRLSTIFYQ